ncbi:hypothetical protein AB0H83_16715 [Dactylosporangium sp. NPDC050688]|uniref:hypothetical protein n=1 Tax=Dactylosporangium sp. NPDC050688 TaxID=3157217 RepID=UPI00340896D7
MPTGVTVLAVTVIGIGWTLAGFAGLADPRSERFLTWRPGVPWSSWSSWTPRPAGEIAPVDGFTVP